MAGCLLPPAQRVLDALDVRAHRQPVPVIEVAGLGQRADLVQEAVHPGTHLPLARAGVDAAVEGHHRQAVGLEPDDALDRLCGDDRLRAAKVIALISSLVSSMLAAATFCSTCSGLPEPGIGRTCGDRVSSPARPTCRSVTPRRGAAVVSAGMVAVSSIGAHGMNTSISWSHRSSIGSEDRAGTVVR